MTNDAGEVDWSPSALSSASDFETHVSTPFVSLRRESWRSFIMKRSEKPLAGSSTSKLAAGDLSLLAPHAETVRRSNASSDVQLAPDRREMLRSWQTQVKTGR